jgi:hypothetical protein
MANNTISDADVRQSGQAQMKTTESQRTPTAAPVSIQSLVDDDEIWRVCVVCVVRGMGRLQRQPQGRLMSGWTIPD